MVAGELIPPGWSVTEKFRKKLDGLSTMDAVNAHLLNLDMRDFGVAWLDVKGKDTLESEDRILQVVSVRNIAISQAEEDFQTSGEFGAGRLLRLTLTDGKSNINALDMDNSPKLSSETAPGTKIRLNGRVPIRVGFLLLKKNNFEVLKSHVESLARDWVLTRNARSGKRSRQTGPDAPPPMVAFGSREAASLIADQNKFQANMRSRNGTLESAFDSMKLAMASTTKSNASGDLDLTDSRFQEKRKEIVAEVAQAKRNDNLDGAAEAPSKHRFLGGGSKFAQARNELAVERDRNLSQLVEMGFSVEVAVQALDRANNNISKAIDNLSSGRSFQSDRGGRGRGRGQVSGRNFGHNIEIEVVPPPSAPVPLTDFMETLPPSSSFASQSQPPPSATRMCITPGTVVLAKDMSGAFQEAKIWRLLPVMNGEQVAQISYLGSPNLHEEIPLTMVKTLDKREITADMLSNTHTDNVAPAPGYRRGFISAGRSRGGFRSSRGSGGGGQREPPRNFSAGRGNRCGGRNFRPSGRGFG